jgi:hypothetical protein
MGPTLLQGVWQAVRWRLLLARGRQPLWPRHQALGAAVVVVVVVVVVAQVLLLHLR